MLDDMATMSQRWPSFGVSTGDTERPPSSSVQQMATPRVASWVTAQLRLLGWCHIHCMLPSFLAVIKTHRTSAWPSSGPRQPVVGDGGVQMLTSGEEGVSWVAAGVAPNGSAYTTPATVPGQIHLDLEAAGTIPPT